MWISNAGFCSLFIVFARIGDDKNITGFIIENDADNVSMGEHKLGIRCFFYASSCSLWNESFCWKHAFWKNGFQVMHERFECGTLKLAAACLDTKEVISNSVKYAMKFIAYYICRFELSVLN
jgi:hypothetical protein